MWRILQHQLYLCGSPGGCQGRIHMHWGRTVNWTIAGGQLASCVPLIYIPVYIIPVNHCCAGTLRMLIACLRT